jgi:CRP/FNR family transcriptional regulator
VGTETFEPLLRSVPYFARLKDEAFADVLAETRPRRYPAGAHLFFEGQAAGQAALHIIAEGSVRVYRASPSGREQTLRVFQAGDTFAEVAAFDGGPYPSTAETLEESTVLRLPRPALLRLMERHPEIAVTLLTTMAGRLRHLLDVVEDLSLRRVGSRLARLLLTEEHRRLNQSQLASLVGTSREMVNRTLHQLSDQGVIRLQDHEIVVLDPRRLTQIVEE